MTRLIGGPELPSNQTEAYLDRKDGSTKVDEVGELQKLHAPHEYGSLVNASTMAPTGESEMMPIDSGTDDDEQKPGLATSLPSDTQGKRARHAAFEDFVRNRAQDIDSRTETVEDLDTEGNITSSRIIDHVRDYQAELFARAKAGNVIAVLDTGSGKTLIAALLLRDIVTKEMDRRASGHAPRSSFFLVGKVRSVYMLWTDVGWHCRQTMLLLQNSSTECFAKI